MGGCHLGERSAPRARAHAAVAGEWTGPAGRPGRDVLLARWAGEGKLETSAGVAADWALFDTAVCRSRRVLLAMCGAGALTVRRARWA